MSDQKPSVGRAVHYVAYGTPGGEFPAGVCRAATITEVANTENDTEDVGLCVMNPTGLFFNRDVPHDEAPSASGNLSDVGIGKPGTWHWPERVGPERGAAA